MRNFRKDDRVSHTRFGPGVVVEVDARYTLIEFDEEGVRKFLTTLVQLERSELPLPVKRAPVRRRGRQVAKGDSAGQNATRADVSEPQTTRPVRQDPRAP